MKSHKQIVCSLYKQALNTSKDWIHDRRAFRIYAMCIRAAFDRRKSETSPQKIDTYLQATRALLLYWEHDSPITCKYPFSTQHYLIPRPTFSRRCYGRKRSEFFPGGKNCNFITGSFWNMVIEKCGARIGRRK